MSRSKLMPTIYINNEGVIIRHELLRSMTPTNALYLTALFHLDECSRIAANTEDPPGHYNGWFCATRPTIFEITGLTLKRQRAALTYMKDIRLIRIRLNGMPAQTQYYIHVDKVLDLFGVAHGDLRRGE